MKIITYINKSDYNRVDKLPYLLTEYNNIKLPVLEGTLRDSTNIITPIITVELNSIPQFNYVYIVEFDRYYYLDSYDIINNKIYELKLSTDILMSNINGILSLNGFVDRNEFNNNKDIIDKKRIVEQGYDVEVSEILGTPFFSNSWSNYTRCYILNGYKLQIGD